MQTSRRAIVQSSRTGTEILERRLIVVSGPVASGKTSVANGLAERARKRGLVAASMDIDLIVEMVRGTDWHGVTRIDWTRAWHASAGLVDSFFEEGFDLVVLAAPLFADLARAEVTDFVHSAPEIIWISLRVSLDESHRRALADPTPSRVLTRDREFLAKLYESIDWEQHPQGDFVIDTEHLSLSEVIDRGEAVALGEAV